jgi:stearoyl-CoA desaturase (delta-9 desaturase)
MTSTHWIKIYYTIGSLSFFFFFDIYQFLSALILGWILSGLAVSVILHRQISHRQFEYKNNFYKFLSYVLIVISGQGSPVGWAAVHREHHANSDQDDDPQNVEIIGQWRTMMSWFHLKKTNHRQLVDILRNKELMFLHNHTGKLFLVYSIMVWILFPTQALTITALVPLMCGLWVGYINTVAHNDIELIYGIKANNIRPRTIFWGESYHKNHHISSSSSRMGPYDLGYYVITFISKKDKPA